MEIHQKCKLSISDRVRFMHCILDLSLGDDSTMPLVNSLRLQTVTRLVPLLVFMKSLCACQFSKFSKAVNNYNIGRSEIQRGTGASFKF